MKKTLSLLIATVLLYLSPSLVSHAQWTAAALSEARHRLAGTATSNFVFFAGGTISNTASSNRVDIYNTSTGNWSTSSLSTHRADLAAASVGNKAFLPVAIRYRFRVLLLLTG
jgi:hypothetical protein